jgi:uncharacterized protein YfcZ (UPF0381/DUF406 family)
MQNKKILSIFFRPFVAGQINTPEKPSHQPADWTLPANCALAEALDSLGITRFTLTRSRQASTCYRFEDSDQKERILYMEKTINAALLRLKVRTPCVNGQAVLNKLRSLQRKFGSDDDGLIRWKVQLQEQKLEERSRHEFETSRQVRRQNVEAKACNIFSAAEMKTITDNKDRVCAFIQLIESKHELLDAVLKHITDEKKNVEHPLQLVNDLFMAQAKLQGVGEESLLPKVLHAFAQHGDNIEDWPVMIQTMYDFAMVASAKDPRGIRWSQSTQDRWAWHGRDGGKKLADNMRGFGWSNAAHADDDAGKASRQQKRKLSQTYLGEGEGEGEGYENDNDEELPGLKEDESDGKYLQVDDALAV